MSIRKSMIATLIMALMIALTLLSGVGAPKAYASATTGYSLIFSHTDPSTETTKSITLPIDTGSGSTAEIAALVSEIGLSQYSHGQVARAESSDTSVVEVYEHPQLGTWYLKALAPTDNEVRLTIQFQDEYEGDVLVTTHKHYWTAKGDKTNALTISCNDDNCYFNNNRMYGTNSFTAQIIAEDVTYDGQPTEQSRSFSMDRK